MYLKNANRHYSRGQKLYVAFSAACFQESYKRFFFRSSRIVLHGANLSLQLYGSLHWSILINGESPAPPPLLAFTPHGLKEHSDMSNDQAANGQQQRKRGERTR